MDQNCADYENMSADALDFKSEVWIGEWALATDTCAHWLNGFNDMNGHPQKTCEYVECPFTYLTGEHEIDFDRTAEKLGPFGGADDDKYQLIMNGQCQSDSLYYNNTELAQLGACANAAFEKNLQGSFMWTAHNEIVPKWDYVKSWDYGWINKTAVADEQFIDVYPWSANTIASEQTLFDQFYGFVMPYYLQN